MLFDPQPGDEIYYRYEDFRQAAPMDEYESPTGEGRPDIQLFIFKVLRHTPKGVVIDLDGGDRFILSAARKRFACPTKEEAMESFLARKNKQLEILRSQINHVKHVIEIAEGMKDDELH